MKRILTLILLTFPILIFSQQLKYQAKNPAFGGETFNHQWLMSTANAQNAYTAEEEETEEQSDIEKFTENLNSQLLNQISKELLNTNLGDGDLEPGTFTLGSLEVEIYEASEGLVVNILNTDSGDQTQIIIPN